jgi:hypothetical protein
VRRSSDSPGQWEYNSLARSRRRRQTDDLKMSRPFGVWLVTIYAAFSALIAALGFYVLFSRTIPSVSGEQANFFATLGVLDYALSALFHICIAIGAVYLFMLRKLALPIFVAGAAFSLITAIWHLLTHRFMAGVGGVSLTGWAELVVAWAIILAVILYTARLSKNGVLT